MNDLLTAAKAVIEATDTGDRWCAIANLSAAVERAEKQEAESIKFDERFHQWFIGHRKVLFELGTYDCAEMAWVAAQQAERNRIRARAKLAAEKTFKAGGYYVGPQHYLIEQFVEELLREDGDE